MLAYEAEFDATRRSGEIARRDMDPHEEVLDEFFRWRDGLYRTRYGIDVIRAIEERINVESVKAKLEPLYFMLAQEHEALGNYAAAEAIHLRDSDQ
jgi:hypothetical protein